MNEYLRLCPTCVSKCSGRLILLPAIAMRHSLYCPLEIQRPRMQLKSQNDVYCPVKPQPLGGKGNR